MRPNWRLALVVFSIGCASSEIKPLEIFPDDACSQCRMAFSDQAFASEMMAGDGLVYKFDDIGCMEKFRSEKPQVNVTAVFYKDFSSKKWLREERALVVRTGINTPMGSGKIAVQDSVEAKNILKQYPPSEEISENTPGCCAMCSQLKKN